MDKLNSDTYKATPDEAAELCVHHLRLAAMFFEMCSDPPAGNLEDEVLRIMGDPQIPHHESPDMIAAYQWIRTIDQAYEKLKELD